MITTLPPQDDRGHLADVEQRAEDRRVGDGRGDRQHQRVGPHHHAGQHGRAGAVAQFEHLADGVDAQPLDPAGEQQAQQQDARADREHQPHARDAVLVAETDAADGGRAAEHDGGHRAGVQHRAEPPAGDQEVGLRCGSAFAPEAERDHADEVDDDDAISMRSRSFQRMSKWMRVGPSAPSAALTRSVRSAVEVVRTPRAPIATARAARSGVRSSTPIGGMPAGGLLVPDLLVAAAVDDDDRHRKPLFHKGHQFLHGEHQCPVAEQHGDRCAGSPDRRADAGGQAVAEGGEAGRVAEPPRRGQVEEVHGAEVGDLRAVAGQRGVGGQRRADRGVDLGVRAGVRPASSRHAARRSRPARARHRLTRGQRRQQRGQCGRRRRRAARGRPGSSCPAGPGRCRSGSRSCPRIWPSHRSESPSSVPTTRSASLSAAAFCSARSRIGRADRQRVRLVDHALAVDSGGDRRAERLGQRRQLGLRVDGAAAGDDQRLGAGGQHLGRAAHRIRIGLWRGSFRACPRLAGPGLLEHVDRDLDVDGTGASAGERRERLGDGRRPPRRRCAPGGSSAPADPLRALAFLASCSWPRSRPSVPVGMPEDSSSIGWDSA